MKRNLITICALFALLYIQISGCSKAEWEQPNLENEFPRILSNWPPKGANGLPGEFNVILGMDFNQQIIYTPTSAAVCTWYLDGEEVATGDVFTFKPEIVGRFYIKVIVRTAENQTFREAYVSVVNP